MKVNNLSKKRVCMMSNRNKYVIIILTAIVVAVGIFLFFPFSNGDEDEVGKTTKKLKELETRDVSKINVAIKEARKKLNSENNNLTLAERFQTCVLIGDSIGEGLTVYNVLDSQNVLAKKGLSTKSSDEYFQKAVSLQPDVVFIQLGMNDMNIYRDNISGYIDAMKEKIAYLKKNIKDVDIYINGILPVSDSAASKTPELGKYPEYNKELKNMCKDEKVTFIDVEQILKSSGKDLHEPDGIHPVSSYYSLWAKYMLEQAEL